MNVKLQHSRQPTIYTHRFRLRRTLICAGISRQRRQHQLRYIAICLFTCTSTLAIHLELTRGLNVDGFLLAFWRFVGWCGLPAILLSDNATTFRSSSKEIQSIYCSPEVFHYLTNRNLGSLLFPGLHGGEGFGREWSRLWSVHWERLLAELY